MIEARAMAEDAIRRYSESLRWEPLHPEASGHARLTRYAALAQSRPEARHAGKKLRSRNGSRISLFSGATGAPHTQHGFPGAVSQQWIQDPRCRNH